MDVPPTTALLTFVLRPLFFSSTFRDMHAKQGRLQPGAPTRHLTVTTNIESFQAVANGVNYQMLQVFSN
jgi:hypothetical protein